MLIQQEIWAFCGSWKTLENMYLSISRYFVVWCCYGLHTGSFLLFYSSYHFVIITIRFLAFVLFSLFSFILSFLLSYISLCRWIGWLASCWECCTFELHLQAVQLFNPAHPSTPHQIIPSVVAALPEPSTHSLSVLSSFAVRIALKTTLFHLVYK